jgi:hypothetical protein
MPRSTTRIVVAAITCAALLAGGASALAAHPKKRAHFSGSFTFTGINGFKAPVAFTVSKDGKTLTGFAYSTLGCFGSGGFQPGVDYYTKPSAIIKIGTVKVASSGSFSRSNVVSSYTIAGYTTTTTSSVRGKFSSAHKGNGTVTFEQKLSGATSSTCHSLALAFSVKG